ncbi:hypothetical protein Lser_V15G02359 [Lactuca serriola]
MKMKIAKSTMKHMMLILLVLYFINDHHASADKSGLVYVDRRGGIGGGGGGGRGFGGVGRGYGSGGAFTPVQTAAAKRTPAHGRGSNNGSHHTGSLLLLVSSMLGLVLL